MSFEIRPLSEHFGVEVVGLDLSRPLDERTFAELRRAWFERTVMVVRGQNLSPAAQVDFSRRFGELQIHVLTQFQVPQHPEVLLLSNAKHPDGTPVGFEDAGRYWHSDLSYDAHPSLGTLLYAIEIPPAGGDTLFVDMYRAYETLPDAIKKRIDGRFAVHSYVRNYAKNESKPGIRPQLTEEQKARLPDVRHPIVRTHEHTGRKALFVNPGFTFAIEGMAEAEGSALLQELFDHALKPEFRYTHVWQPHDLLCWDNRGTMHHATLYDPKYIRHMHRTTIKGPRPV
jgi:taurine dioxygenase